jgi:hypothetical protein
MNRVSCVPQSVFVCLLLLLRTVVRASPASSHPYPFLFYFYFCVCRVFACTGALKNLGVGITDAVMLGDQVVGLVGILGKVHVRGKRHVWLSSRRQQHRRCYAALQRICLTGSLAHTLADVVFFFVD